jgi:hypothetical protein
MSARTSSYVKLIRTIWQDADFLRLPLSSQRLYMLLISQADITHVGILPLMPTRWARLAPDTTAESVRDDLDALAVDNFVVVDNDTEEVLVRTYLVHDEAFKIPNGKKALVAAYGRVLSRHLQTVIAGVLGTVGVTVASTLPATVGPSQQPAASTSNHEPAASSQHHDVPDDADDFDGAIAHPAAAAALVMLLRLRVATARTNPAGLKAKLRRDLPTEHGPALDRYLKAHPDATAHQLATEVLKVPGVYAEPMSEAALEAAQVMSGAGYGRAVAEAQIDNELVDAAAFEAEIADRPQVWRDAALVAYRASVHAVPSNVVELRRQG